MDAFLHGFLLSLSLCLDLGLVNIVTLRISLTRGANPAFVLGLGSVIGDLIYFSFTILGASALLESRAVRLTLWIFGTATLLFLAMRAVREVLHPKLLELDGQVPDRRTGVLKLFATGIGLALASPTAILWFAAVGGSVIASYGDPNGDSRRILGIFSAGFVTAGILWAGLFSYGAAALKNVLGWRLVKGLSFATALLFLYFAGDVFVRGLREFYP